MKYRPRLKIYKGNNGKNTFNPDTFVAKSYDWWVYVRKINGQIIFNDYNYSVTTNQHQWSMKSLLKELGYNLNKDVIFVDQRASLTDGIDLEPLYSSLILNEIRLAKSGQTKATKNDLIKSIKKLKSEIKTIRRIDKNAKFSAKQKRDLKTLLETIENERLESAREKAREYRAKRKVLEATYRNEANSTKAISI